MTSNNCDYVCKKCHFKPRVYFNFSINMGVERQLYNHVEFCCYAPVVINEAVLVLIIDLNAADVL